MRKSLLVAAAASALALTAGPALADPVQKQPGTLVLTCGTKVYDIAVAGNGQWTPAHDLNSTTVWQPVAFGPSTSTYEVLDGPNRGQTGSGPTDPGSAKAGLRNGVDTQECSYTGTSTFFEPNIEGNLLVTFEGAVTLKVTTK